MLSETLYITIEIMCGVVGLGLLITIAATLGMCFDIAGTYSVLFPVGACIVFVGVIGIVICVIVWWITTLKKGE